MQAQKQQRLTLEVIAKFLKAKDAQTSGAREASPSASAVDDTRNADMSVPTTLLLPKMLYSATWDNYLQRQGSKSQDIMKLKVFPRS